MFLFIISSSDRYSCKPLMPSEAIWLKRYWPLLAQAMACHLYSAQSHHLNQCWFVLLVGPPGNTFQGYFIGNANMIIQGNALAIAACKISAILFRFWCVETGFCDISYIASFMCNTGEHRDAASSGSSSSSTSSSSSSSSSSVCSCSCACSPSLSISLSFFLSLYHSLTHFLYIISI